MVLFGIKYCTGASNVSQIPNTKSLFSLCCNPPIYLRKNSAVRFVSCLLLFLLFFSSHTPNSPSSSILPILLLRKVEWYGWYGEKVDWCGRGRVGKIKKKKIKRKNDTRSGSIGPQGSDPIRYE